MKYCLYVFFIGYSVCLNGMTRNELINNVRLLQSSGKFQEAQQLLEADVQQGPRALLSPNERDRLLIEVLTFKRTAEEQEYAAQKNLAQLRTAAQTELQNLAQALAWQPIDAKSAADIATWFEKLYSIMPQAKNLEQLSHHIHNNLQIKKRAQHESVQEKVALQNQLQQIKEEQKKTDQKLHEALVGDVTALTFERIALLKQYNPQIQSATGIDYFGLLQQTIEQQLPIQAYRDAIDVITDTQTLERIRNFLANLPLLARQQEEFERPKEEKEEDITPIITPSQPGISASAQELMHYNTAIQQLFQTAGIQSDANLANALTHITDIITQSQTLFGTNLHNIPETKIRIEQHINAQIQGITDMEQKIETVEQSMEDISQEYLDILVDSIIIRAQTDTIYKKSLQVILNIEVHTPDAQKKALMNILQNIESNREKVSFLQGLITKIEEQKL